METKKKFEAPEIKLVDLKAGASILAGSMSIGGDGGAIITSLGSATFNWSNGTLS